MSKMLFVVDEDCYFWWHRLDLARAAREAGFEVAVATRVQAHGRAIEQEGFRLIPLRLRRGLQSPVRDALALIELIRLYRRERPEILHHFSLKPVLFGSLAARLCRMPAMVNTITGLGYLFHANGGRRSLLRTAITPVLRWALGLSCSAVIFENHDDCGDLVEAGIVRPSHAVVIRGAGVNGVQFAPSPEPTAREPIVFLPARMVWDKGIGEFVDAAKLLKASGVRARFVLAGGMDPENPTAIPLPLLQQWQNEGIVEWWGHREDMPSVLAMVHIVVLPSYHEGLPKSLMEAAACGRPIVATDIRGCREIVQDGKNGFLVPVKNAEALADRIAQLLSDGALRTRMGMKGRELVEREFRIERIASETIAVYRRLLTQSASIPFRGVQLRATRT